ncbi:unnamed protein product, partial [Rotaria socialis]
WLFHVEGFDNLFNNGTALEDDDEFDINSIHSKLSRIGNQDTLNIGSILIVSIS